MYWQVKIRNNAIETLRFLTFPKLKINYTLIPLLQSRIRVEWRFNL